MSGQATQRVEFSSEPNWPELNDILRLRQATLFDRDVFLVEWPQGIPVKTTIPIDKKKIAEICRRHHIQKLSLFGSVLRDDFGPDSDVDVLVEYQPGRSIGFEVFDIEEELSHLFGHPVDLVTQKYLNPRLRERVLNSAEIQYAEG